MRRDRSIWTTVARVSPQCQFPFGFRAFVAFESAVASLNERDEDMTPAGSEKVDGGLLAESMRLVAVERKIGRSALRPLAVLSHPVGALTQIPARIRLKSGAT